MASISKRSWTHQSGEIRAAYQVRYTKLNGKIARKQFPKRKDAELFRRKVEPTEPKQAHLRECYTSAKTVEEGFREYLEALKQGAVGRAAVEQSTLQTYEAKIRAHLVPLFGLYKLADLTPSLCRKFRDDLAARISDRRYASQVWRFFCQMIREMKARGALSGDPTDGLAIYAPTPSEAGEAPKMPQPEQVSRIVGFARQQSLEGSDRTRKNWRKWSLLIEFGFQTGLRIGEILALPWSNVDLERRSLRVTQTLKLNLRTIGKPKTKRALRTVWISKSLAESLRSWKDACPAGDLGLVFPGNKGQPLNYTSFRTCVWNAIMSELGYVDEHGKSLFTPHSMRHFKASASLSAPNARLLDVSRELGHAHIQTTIDTYGHQLEKLAESAGRDRASYLHELIQGQVGAN